MARGSPRRQAMAAAVVALGLLALAATTAHRLPRLGPVGDLAAELVARAAAPAYRAAAWVRAQGAALVELARLREENRRLREELARYRALEPAMLEAIEGHARLKALLGLKQRYGDAAVAAQVLLRAPDRWFEQVVIGVGAQDGVAPGMPVVTAEGLVGRVVQVGQRHAAVMLITDPASGVGGMVVQTREAGVVLGSHVQRGRLLFRLYVADALLAPGQLVVTSGYGGSVPPGIPIGIVERVERGQLTPLATLRPLADLDRLTEVLVLKVAGPAPDLTPSPWLEPRVPDEPHLGPRWPLEVR